VKRKFPTWWQALMLVAGGVIIAFSSCAGMLSGIGGGQSRELSQLYAYGFLAGIAAFLVGIVLFIVVAILALARAPDDAPVLGVIPASPESKQVSGVVLANPRVPAPAPHPAGGVISRATHPQLFPDASIAAAPPSTQVQAALARLHIAIFVSILASSFSLWRSVALYQRPPYSHYFLIYAIAFALGQVPYVIVLVRTWRRPDRAGLALAIAASFAYALSALQVFGFVQYRYRMTQLNPSFWVHAALDVLIIVLAYLVRRAASLRRADVELLISFFFGVLVYTMLITVAERYLMAMVRF
jgi:hypothetical protein